LNSAYIAGIGLSGPGLDGWAAGRAVLAGIEAYQPADLPRPTGASLPAIERRRSTLVTRLAVDVAGAALGGADPGSIAAVFASSGGEVQVIHDIFEQLAGTDRRLSPTAFHNSVHNAASGYWSIATGCRGPTDSLCAYDDSLGSGLAEALLRCGAEGMDTLLVAYDLPPPLPIAEFRPLSAPFGVALLLRAAAGPGAIGELRGRFLAEALPATRMDDPGLERLRLGNPAARSLPLLVALARGAEAEILIGCGMGGSLWLEVRPWP
jgi:hypothetical protein